MTSKLYILTHGPDKTSYQRYNYKQQTDLFIFIYIYIFVVIPYKEENYKKNAIKVFFEDLRI